MTIIQFPGGGSRRGDGDDVERAAELKRRLIEFVTRGPLAEAHTKEMVETGLEEPELHEFIDFTDWFIFEWENDEGIGAIDEFLSSEPDLPDADRRILEGWFDAIDDVFQVQSIARDGVTLRDAEGTIYFAVPTNMAVSELGWKVKTLVHTRLAPVGSVYILSGIQSFYEGEDVEQLPDGVDFAAFARDLEEAESELEDGTFIVADVRHLPPDERPDGSVVAAAYAYLAEVQATLKAQSVEAQAVAVSLFVHFCGERGLVRLDEVDGDILVEFLATWYPPVAQDRTVGATRKLVATICRFALWLDRFASTTIGADFKTRLVPLLEDDLPRTIKAADVATRTSVERAGAELHVVPAPHEQHAGRGRAEAFQSRFVVESVSGRTLTLRERTLSTETLVPLHALDVHEKLARLLRPGDVVEGLFSMHAGKLGLDVVECIYCSASGM